MLWTVSPSVVCQCVCHEALDNAIQACAPAPQVILHALLVQLLKGACIRSSKPPCMIVRQSLSSVGSKVPAPSQQHIQAVSNMQHACHEMSDTDYHYHNAMVKMMLTCVIYRQLPDIVVADIVQPLSLYALTPAMPWAGRAHVPLRSDAAESGILAARTQQLCAELGSIPWQSGLGLCH